MPTSPNGVFAWDLHNAAGSFYTEDGFLDIGYDAYGEQGAGVDPSESHLPHGLIARPHDPDSDGAGNLGRACQVLIGNEGGQTHAFLCGDPRVLERLPQVPKGTGSAYGGPLGKDPSYAYFDGDTGAYTMVVGYAHGPDGKSTKAHTIVVDGAEQTITIAHGAGASIQLTNAGIVANGASVSLGQASAAQPVAMGPAVVQALTALSNGLSEVGAAAALALGAQAAGPAAIAASAEASSAIAQVLATNTLAS